jgi:hypothetical protein
MTYPVFTTGEILRAADMNAVGLWKIADQTVSAATEFVFDNCFTSDYMMYRVTVSITTSTATGLLLWQERVGGANANTAYTYSGTLNQMSGGTPIQTLIGEQNVAHGAVADFDNAGSSQGHAVFDIANPQTSPYTSVSSQYSVAAGNTGISGGQISSNHYVSTVYDGLRLFVSSGNFTGTCRIYGYRN